MTLPFPFSLSRAFLILHPLRSTLPRYLRPMPHIRFVPEDQAEGELARLYDEARKRAGKVFHIVQAISLAPRQLRASMAIYREVMFGESPLSRAQREMIAVTVSRANACHY